MGAANRLLLHHKKVDVDYGELIKKLEEPCPGTKEDLVQEVKYRDEHDDTNRYILQNFISDS